MHARMPSLGRTIPALPVRDVREAASWMASRFGFATRHLDDGFAVVARDEAVLHLWGAADEGWRTRADLAARPICSGAESFIAGTASCRIEVGDVDEVDALFGELRDAGVLHPTSRSPEDTDFGTREFHTLDQDGNLLTFFAARSDGS
jgi:catechol 2,3-dioxygenase-like lactoylglutathione lyase family enzyme